MHRDQLLTLLDTYQQSYPEEALEIQRYRDFVERNPDCFERRLEIGHVTGSAWLLNPAASHVLLTHHRKLGRWLQVGGHADGEADVMQVALREAKEESGIEQIVPLSSEIFDLDIHPIPARQHEAAHLHYDVRFVLSAAHDDIVVSDESHDLQWVAIDKVQAFAPDLSRMAQKWLTR